jgi:hypothetical protein
LTFKSLFKGRAQHYPFQSYYRIHSHPRVLLILCLCWSSTCLNGKWHCRICHSLSLVKFVEKRHSLLKMVLTKSKAIYDFWQCQNILTSRYFSFFWSIKNQLHIEEWFWIIFSQKQVQGIDTEIFIIFTNTGDNLLVFCNFLPFALLWNIY